MSPQAYNHLLVTSGDKMLLVESADNPAPGILCMPAGKMRSDDSFESSIERELTKLQLAGECSKTPLCPVNVRYKKGDEVIMQRPGIIWHINYVGPLNETKTKAGKAEWWDITKASQAPKLAPEIAVALSKIVSGSKEPIELTIML